MVIVHTGQTGVERGACHAAREIGLPRLGVMPSDGCDELGSIPPEIRVDLVAALERGQRAALRSCIELATAVLVIVPLATAPRFSSMSVVLRTASEAGRACFVADTATSPEEIAAWVASQPPGERMRLFVTGPRGTRWTSGEAVAQRIVSGLARTTAWA
jgi:hypothetical protein